MSNLIYTNCTKVFHPTTYLLVSICSAKKHLQLQFCLIKIAQYELTTISGWCNRKSYLLQVMVIPNPQHCQNFHLFVFFFWCEWLPNDKLFGFLSLTRAHKKKLFVTNKHVRPVNGIWKHWTQHVFQLTNENVISKKDKKRSTTFNAHQANLMSLCLKIAPGENLDLKFDDQLLWISIGLRLVANIPERTHSTKLDL